MNNYLANKIVKDSLPDEKRIEEMKSEIEGVTLRFSEEQINDMIFIKNTGPKVIYRLAKDVLNKVSSPDTLMNDVMDRISKQLAKEPVFTKVLDLSTSGAEAFGILKRTIEYYGGNLRTVSYLSTGITISTIVLEKLNRG